jgi:hypothetical protein
MPTILRIILALVVTALYLALNWVGLILLGVFSFAGALFYGPGSLLLGFLVAILVFIGLLVGYVFLIMRIMTKRNTQTHAQS